MRWLLLVLCIAWLSWLTHTDSRSTHRRNPYLDMLQVREFLVYDERKP